MRDSGIWIVIMIIMEMTITMLMNSDDDYVDGNDVEDNRVDYNQRSEAMTV